MDPRSWPREWLLIAGGVLLALVVVQAAKHALARWWRRRTILARVKRAGEGELRAAGWLTDQGYEILGAQVPATYTLAVDGAPVVASLRADYLVTRGDARFVVEVKTGNVAPRIETSATRRQLLEYRVAFDVDGVLLVDAERGTIHEVTFPDVRLGAPASGARFWWLAFSVVALALLALALR